MLRFFCEGVFERRTEYSSSGIDVDCFFVGLANETVWERGARVVAVLNTVLKNIGSVSHGGGT